MQQSCDYVITAAKNHRKIRNIHIKRMINCHKASTKLYSELQETKDVMT